MRTGGHVTPGWQQDAHRLRRMDSRPIGVFDSGVGGLTVLHECLVTMPHEDFVYLGDHARLPYGPRPLPEIARFAHEIAAYLEREGVKLIVVACNAATSAALPALQSSLARPRRRGDRARGGRRGARHAQPQDRPARDPGHRRRRPLRGARPHARRRRALHGGRLPRPRAADRGRRADGGRRPWLRGAAEGGGMRHGDPRLHPLPADPARPPARLRATT